MERIVVWYRASATSHASADLPAHAEALKRSAREELTALGGQVVSESLGTLALSLAPEQVEPTVKACLKLAAEAEGTSRGKTAATIAVVRGLPQIGSPDDPLGASALDRAEELANALHPGEVALCGGTQALCAGTFLYRRIATSEGGTEGVVVDCRFPLRVTALGAITRLRTPDLWPQAQVQLQALKHLAGQEKRRRILLVGELGCGASAWLNELAHYLRPSTWINIGARAAALAPLSGLSLALRELPDSAQLEQTFDVVDLADQQALETLRAVSQGRAAQRRAVVSALRRYLSRSAERSGRPALVVVNPTSWVDSATVGVIAEVSRDGGPDACFVLRLLPGAKPPQAFTRAGPPAEVRVPGLSSMDARKLAQSLLGQTASSDIAPHAAAMGGSSPLAVAEAVRMLVGMGDLVYNNGFEWRLSPSGKPAQLSLDLLFEQRLNQLPRSHRAVLEVLASVPESQDRTLVYALCAQEGITAEQTARICAQLSSLALLDLPEERPRVSPSLRRAIDQAIDPNRKTLLADHIADLLRDRLEADASFARADMAYQLARADRRTEAADAYLEASIRAGQSGFVRAGVQLAAAAVDCDPTDATREKAARLAEALNEKAGSAPNSAVIVRAPVEVASERADTVRPSAHASSLSSRTLERAVQALCARDFEALDREFELLTASGESGPHVLRLHAMAELAKGRRGEALALLAQAQGHRPGSAATPQAALAMALVHLDDGAHALAVRETLRALMYARQRSDPRGERAALSLLAACYRFLRRPREAAQIQEAAYHLLPVATGGSPA